MLVVGSVVAVTAVVVAVAALVLVTCGVVVVGRDAAPDVLTVLVLALLVLSVLVGVAPGKPFATEVVGTPSLAPPVLLGNDGPEELAAALEREWTGR